jgi:hypothetical protein
VIACCVGGVEERCRSCWHKLLSLALAADSEDFDSEDLVMSTYDARSIHKKSGARSTDRRDGTRDSKPQSQEDWCKQYAADEIRCPSNDYCIKNNLCGKKEQ